MNHTPTPWAVDSDNRFVVGPEGQSIFSGLALDDNNESEANAAFIVKACNCHERLVKLLERVGALTYAHDLELDAELCNLLKEIES